MIIIFALIAVISVWIIIPTNNSYEYDCLRIHIRANSNKEVDQSIKYEIKDMLVEFLTPIFEDVKSKDEAIEKVEDVKYIIESKCDQFLKERGFDYKSNIKVNNEYFPTRTYVNTTLESGYYDAVIVELGEANGDNWWCVMYPPLCFVNKNDTDMQIKFKSKILEWIDWLF